MEDTNISFLTSELYNEFLDFNKKAFPKGKKIEELIKYQILQNPLLKNKSCPKVLVACNNKKEIVGQFVCNPCELYFNDRNIESHRTYDFYVLRDFRKTGIGTALARGVCKYAKPCITVGVSKMGINIALSVGELVGSLYKFLWFKDLACWIKALFSYLFKKESLANECDLKHVRFPEVLQLRDYNFHLTRRVETWKESFWDNCTLQFIRSDDFIKWRFLQRPGIYYLYILENMESSSYFVVRKSKWRTLNILEIVDYRVPYRDKKTFNSILNASKLLAKDLGFDGLMTKSSHAFFDQCLFSNFFIRNNQPEAVITNLKLDIVNQQSFATRHCEEQSDEAISLRKTLADCFVRTKALPRNDVNQEDYYIDRKKIKKRDFLYVTGVDCDSEFIN